MTEKEIKDKAKTKLQALGFVSWWPPHVRFYERDIFGTFDFIAAKGSKIILVQITSVSNLSARRKKILAFLDLHKLDFREAWVWAYRESSDTFEPHKISRHG